MALRLRQHGQLRHWRGGSAFQRLHQSQQGRLQVGHDAARVDALAALRRHGKAVRHVVDAHGERIVGQVFRAQHAHAFEDQVGVAAAVVGRGDLAVAVVQQGAKQRQRRRHAASALGQRQRRLLMRQQFAHALVSLQDDFAHAAARQRDAQRQGIDEHAQGPVGALRALQAAQQDGAEHHFFAAAAMAKHLRHGDMEQHCGIDAVRAGGGTQARGQRGRQVLAHFVDGAAIALDVEQAIRRRRFVDVGQLGAEIRLMRAGRHGVGMRDEVTVWQHWRQDRLCTAFLGRQDGADFIDDEFQGDVVAHHVMAEQHQEPALRIRIGRHVAGQQRRAAQIQAQLAGVGAFEQLGQRSAAGGQLQGFHGQRRVAVDHLHRLRQAFPAHGAAQDVMARDHHLHRFQVTLQALLRIEGKHGAQQIGVASGLQQVMEQDAFLQRGKRIDVGDIGRALRHAGGDQVDLGLGQADQRQHVRRNGGTIGGNALRRHDEGRCRLLRGGGGHGAQGRRAEDAAHVEVHALLAYPLDQRHHQQRMAAQLEELVLAPHAGHAQQVLPDGGHGRFCRVQRRLVVAHGQRGLVRLRQCLAIQLAIWRARQFIEQDEGGRHHVRRQLGSERFAQLRRQQHGLRLRQHIRHQAFVARCVFTHQHHRLAHAVKQLQACFDLAQLDAETAQLDLVVDTADEFQVAVGAPARQVAAAVATAAGRAERIGDETLGRQFRQVQVALRHAVAGHMQLASHAQRHRLTIAVEQVNAAVADRTADRQLFHVVGQASRHHIAAAEDGALGRAVAVDQADLGIGALQLSHMRRRDLFATHHQLAHAAQQRHVGIDHGVEEGGSNPHQVHPMRLHRRANLLRRGIGARIQHGAAAMGQHGPQFQGQRIPRGGRVLQRDASGRVIDIVDTEHETEDALVRDRHALRTPGGAGRVHAVGQVVGRGARRRIAVRLQRQQRIDPVHAQQHAPVQRQRRRQRAVAEHHRAGRIIEHEGQAFGRIRGIERHIGGARLEDAQQAGYHVGAALDADGHAVTGSDAEPDQVMCEAVGAAIQFPVRDELAIVAQRHGQRLGSGAVGKQFVHQPVLRARPYARIEAVEQHGAFGRGQQRQGAGDHWRIGLQRGHQALHGLLHILRHAQRIDARGAQCMDGKAVAQVIDRDGQRVVGALFAAQQRDAGQAHAGAAVGAVDGIAVAVVQQGGE